MSSVLHFSPVFKPSLSLSSLTSSNRSSKKRKRSLESLIDNGRDRGGEGSEVDSAANGTSLPSAYSSDFVTTPLAASDVGPSHSNKAFQSRTSSHIDNEGSSANDISQNGTHQFVGTVPSIFRGRISDELATFKPPLYVAMENPPNDVSEKFTGGMRLRHYHLKTITAVLHKCLSECDYIRAGRAWAILLRAEQLGQSMDLRAYDRWGVGAEILIQRESQLTRKTLDYRMYEASNPTSYLRVKSETIEKAKEYYERLLLQYPYRKAFPSAIGALDFSIALFTLWIYAVKERNSRALMAVGNSNERIDEIVAGANGDSPKSPTSHIQPDPYQNIKQVKQNTLQNVHEIADRLDELLAFPPYSGNAKVSKLRGQIALWIADLSVAPISSEKNSSVSGNEEDLTVEELSLPKNSRRSTSLSKDHWPDKSDRTPLQIEALQ